MPKKAAKDTDKGKAERDQSDAELLQERQRVEAFQYADLCLRSVGWSLWALAGCWFFLYNQAIPTLLSANRGVGDGVNALVACGILCGGLGRASPRATWSSWRPLWHAAWVGCMVVLATMFFLARRVQNEPGRPAPSGGAFLAPALLVLGLFQGSSIPRVPPSPAKGANLTAAWLLCLANGAYGLFICRDVANSAPWSEQYASLTVTVTVVPLAMMSVAFLCCRSEGEMLAAVNAALMLYFGALVKIFAVEESLLALLPTAVLLLAHLALFLPLPPQDVGTNPFHMSIVKSFRRMHKLLSDPVSGYGDSGED